MKPLGKICKSFDLSLFNDSGVKSSKVAMSLNFKLLGAGNCCQKWLLHSWPTTVLKSPLSDCESKWVSGGWIASGRMWVLLSLCSWGLVLLWEGNDVWVVRGWRGDRRGHAATDKWPRTYTNMRMCHEAVNITKLQTLSDKKKAGLTFLFQHFGWKTRV